MKHDYGLDTLTVNGRFESYGDGFKKTIKVLFFGSLNAAGITVKIFSLLNPSVIRLVAPKAIAILRNKF